MTRCLLIALSLLLPAAGVGAANDDAEVALQFALARSLSEEGDVSEALEAWQDLLAMAPSEPYVRIEYGRFLSRISRLDAAVEQVTSARDLAPQNPDVLRAYVDINLAASRSDPERLEAAREALQELVAVRPEDIEAMFELGRIYHEQGRFVEAADWLGQAAQMQPANRTLQLYRLDALLQSEQRDVAERVLTELLTYDTSFLRGRLQLAMLKSDRGDHAGAAQMLRDAPAEQLADRELRWQLAGQLYRLGELDAGVAAIDSILLEDPEAFRERMLKAMMLSAQGLDAAAIEQYGALRQMRPLNLDIVSELVKLYERQGEPRRAEAALRDLDRTLAEAGNEARRTQVQFDLLSLLWRSEAWDRLAQEARPLAEDPDSPLHAQGVFYLADALHGERRSAEALELLRQTQEGAVASPRALARQAEILVDLDRSEEAEALLQQLATGAELPSLMAAAEVYQRQARYSEAVTVLRKALEYDATSSQVLYWLGAAQERSGNPQAATQTFRDLLARNPRHAPTLNYLGYMWAEQGEHLDEALDLAMDAVAQEPDNGAYVDSLGWAHYQLGDYLRARELLERAARLVPDDAVISEHLGDTYARLGDSYRARESYRRAIQLDGDNREAVRKKLDRLVVSR